jgi:uncharacterized membrane protein
MSSILTQPEFYDIFGFITFTLLIIIAIYSFKTKKPLKPWMNYFLLIIGILGLIVDGIIVFTTFAK